MDISSIPRFTHSLMTAHRDNDHAVPALPYQRQQKQQKRRPASTKTVAKMDPPAPRIGHRRKIRRVSPRSASHSSHSSGDDNDMEEEGEGNNGGDGDDETPGTMADADAFIAARNNSTRKSPLPAAHEIKYLRHEAATLERQFGLLCAKWKTHLPDMSVRLLACEAAKQKTITMQVERINAELKQQLLQQQLFFSSLQSSLSESPLWPSSTNCQAIFNDVHHELRLLDNSDAKRRAALQTRFDSALRQAPAVVDRYTIDHVRSTTSAIPYSHTSTSGTDTHTFVSNVFICKIANATLERVFQATMDHYTNLPEQLNRHLAMGVAAKPIYSLNEARHYSQLEYGSGDFTGVLCNVTFQAEMLRDDLAVLVVDFVDDDELYPHDDAVNSLRKDGLSILTLSLVHDESTGQSCVLLRRLLVHRYNLLPNSSRLHNEVNSMVSYFNGDLSMAMLCQALQANTHQSPSK